jgi:tetraacyldisaccharide 4'-kinase
LLRLPALLYGFALRLRNARYDRPGAALRAGVPVVSVGNITVGGTGKTPVVAWIAKHLLDWGLSPAVVSRGYGGRAGRGPLLVSAGEGALHPAAHCGDEPHQLARALPGVRVVVGSDRPAGAELARRGGADVVVLDDGFQHRRLARDLDILLIDAKDPFGNGHLLPAGPLREPLDALGRADLFLLTRSTPEQEYPEIERVLRRHNRRAPVLMAGHARAGFVTLQGTPSIRPERALAFCGIGNPESFRADLVAEGIELVDFRAFPDHHAYTAGEIHELAAAASAARAMALTTEKDLARLCTADAAVFLEGLCALRIQAQLYRPGPLLDVLRAVAAGGRR